MPAEPYTAVDVEGLVREWARDTISLVGRRVYFAPSQSGEWPQLVLFRIRGPDEACLIQFDIHTNSVHGKATAEAVRQQLVEAVNTAANYKHGDAVIRGASVFDERWLPDLESGAARYVVEAYFTASAAE